MDCQALSTSTCPPGSVKLVSTPWPSADSCLLWVRVGRWGWEVRLDLEAQQPTEWGRAGFLAKAGPGPTPADQPCVAHLRTSSLRSVSMSMTLLASMS